MTSTLVNNLEVYKFDDLTIFNSIFEYIDSNMYILVENNLALVIDPHFNPSIDVLLKDNGVDDVTVFLTHEHTDHVSGIEWLKKNFNTTVVSTDYCSKYLSDERLNRPILALFMLEEKDKNKGTHYTEKFKKEYQPYVQPNDITFEDEFSYSFNSHNFKFKKLLGHSKGSCCIILDDKYIFTGDTLLKDYPVITRFPGGNKKEYVNSTIPYFESLDENLIVLPGHGKSFVLKEVKNNGKLKVEFR